MKKVALIEVFGGVMKSEVISGSLDAKVMRERMRRRERGLKAIVVVCCCMNKMR